MEIEIIDESKIKIILDGEEMNFFGIRFDELNYNDAKTKSFLTKLLNNACIITKTDYIKGHVLVEAYPAPDGGCIICFVRLFDKSSKKSAGIKVKTTRIYAIANSNQMMSIIEQLYRLVSIISFDSLYLLNEKYYLLIICEMPNILKISQIIYEFNGKLAKIQNSSYYREHAKSLCNSHAIEIIGQNLTTNKNKDYDSKK